jgi:plasmid stabilization system protein ParE
MTGRSLSRMAERDLDEIKEFLIEKRSFAVARRGLGKIEAGLRLDLTPRAVKFWPVYSYVIIYDPLSDQAVQIVRSRMATGTWKAISARPPVVPIKPIPNPSVELLTANNSPAYALNCRESTNARTLHVHRPPARDP